MDFDEAAKILKEATRSELRDHAFGDREIFWEKDGKDIAGGYLGRGVPEVWFIGKSGCFTDEEARELAKLGISGRIERNDETGPDEYKDGEVMPGLSKGDVYKELTGEYLDNS